MSVTDDTFNPAALARSDTITLAGGSKNNTASTPKQAKTTQTYPRIDYEPLYNDLKVSLGHNWETYNDAFSRFMKGEINSSEFADLCDEHIYSSPALEHMHNCFIAAIVFNICRDVPEPGPAIWVTASTDKSIGALSSKPAISSDVGEQRLKAEVMALPTRDRRRLKAVNLDKAEEDGLLSRKNAYEEYYQASRIKAPDAAPANAGGLTTKNWDLEIKKRYAQPLFAESLEFPDAATVFARMVPICYEESVSQGSSMVCAELVATSAEVYLKEFLGTVLNRTRSNGPRYDNGFGGGILTAKFKKQLLKEEDAFKDGKLQKNRDDELLPVESQALKSRRPLGIADFKLANRVGPLLWNGMPLIGYQVNEAPTENDYDEWHLERRSMSQMNGHIPKNEDDMDIDEDDYDWEGAGYGDRGALDSLLDDCLAMPA